MVKEVILIRGTNKQDHSSAFVIFTERFIADRIVGKEVEYQRGQKLYIEQAMNPNDLRKDLKKEEAEENRENYRINHGKSVLFKTKVKEVDLGESCGKALLDLNMKALTTAIQQLMIQFYYQM